MVRNGAQFSNGAISPLMALSRGMKKTIFMMLMVLCGFAAAEEIVIPELDKLNRQYQARIAELEKERAELDRKRVEALKVIRDQKTRDKRYDEAVFIEGLINKLSVSYEGTVWEYRKKGKIMTTVEVLPDGKVDCKTGKYKGAEWMMDGGIFVFIFPDKVKLELTKVSDSLMEGIDSRAFHKL